MADGRAGIAVITDRSVLKGEDKIKKKKIEETNQSICVTRLRKERGREREREKSQV